MQVRITIRGREYTVRGDDNAEALQALAADLDRRMAETAERTRSFDEYTIAMLTALNIASELHQLKGQVAQRLDEIDRDAASVAAMIEAALRRRPGVRRAVIGPSIHFIGATVLVVTSKTLKPDPSGIGTIRSWV